MNWHKNNDTHEYEWSMLGLSLAIVVILALLSAWACLRL